MIYQYDCDSCGNRYNVFQQMNDEHVYTCPDCHKPCRRVYSFGAVKKNEGFFSWTLGEYVGSHSEFEEKLQRTRYVTGMSEKLNDNRTPKDEWVETRHKNLEEERRQAREMKNAEG